jgi:cytoskeleton protein RodZ
MSEEQDRRTGKQGDPDDDEGPMAGERLRQARHEQQISVLEVAKELHLDEPKVRALERNEFDVLGAPVFAKGHLRKYAQLVGVDEDDVFADYYAMTRTLSMPPIVVGRKKVRRESSPGPWIALVIVIIVAAAAYWWFGMRESASLDPEPQSSAETDAPAVLAAASPVDTASISEDSTTERDAVPESLPEPVRQLPPDGHVNLSISYSGDCWTEISDADGRSLFVGMAYNGRTVQLTGKAPISALFGNIDNVSVQVNDDDYPLPASTSANRRLRLTISSP